ncbi:FMN-binding negative transcriptional regulator [Salipiger aestuarii]|uniref:FMN-binding negative transcriptional regulator n=1 Tax=Salipiger aestuarii TaxID=568098 RepID=UPI001238BAB9|nr:FMN-binding negative transcriptional regulator [Salipiger aestuarii]KAA8616122.1 negative transcriptional regulator [Salipiger aestuarii]
MHPNQIFRTTPEARSLTFARDRAFGVLAISSSRGAPLLSHVPYLLSDDGGSADLHLVRSNPLVGASKDGVAATLAISGADGYVSPDWYGLGPDQVPTWNYVAVHLTGRLDPLPPDTLPDMLARQSAFFESRLLPKPPWNMDKMSDDLKTRFLRMILPFRLHIAQVDSTWKLGQNKPDATRESAAARLDDGFGQDLGALAALMRAPQPPD